MAYVIAEPCIGTKDTACVDVCPVDCIHPAKNRDYHAEGDEVTCPWHAAKFKVCTGEVLSPPAPQAVGSYKVRVNGPDIELEL